MLRPLCGVQISRVVVSPANPRRGLPRLLGRHYLGIAPLTLFVSDGVAQTTEPLESKMAVQVQPATFEPPATDVKRRDRRPRRTRGRPRRNPPSEALAAKRSRRNRGWLDTPCSRTASSEKWGQGIEKWKSQWPVSVTGGAYNWWHVNNGGPLASGYGIPGVPGTHSYYLFVDKEQPVDWGEITKIGGARPDAVPRQRRAVASVLRQRRFLVLGGIRLSRHAAGTFEDGLRLQAVRPVLGRFVVGQRAVHGRPETPQRLRSLAGGHTRFQGRLQDRPLLSVLLRPESRERCDPRCRFRQLCRFRRRNTFIARAVPTWKLGEKQTFALGISATVGGIDNQPTLIEYGTNQALPALGTRPLPAGPSTGLGPRPLETARGSLATLRNFDSQPLHFRRPKQSLYRWTRGDHLHPRPPDLPLRLLVGRLRQPLRTPGDVRAGNHGQDHHQRHVLVRVHLLG